MVALSPGNSKRNAIIAQLVESLKAEGWDRIGGVTIHSYQSKDELLRTIDKRDRDRKRGLSLKLSLIPLGPSREQQRRKKQAIAPARARKVSKKPSLASAP
ncbi:MAG: hypothetical protein ACLQO1_07740 [Steroidobacteraceae bacterium]